MASDVAETETEPVPADTPSAKVVPVAPAPTPDPETAEVSVNDVSFRYPGGVETLSHLNLVVPPATTVSIVGPSGCGKSTLLSLIGGLMRPTTGTVARRPAAADRLAVAMVFQKDTLLPWMKVRDQVALHFRFRRRRRADVKAWVESLLELAGLEEFGDAYPYQLSGGMRRRVAFLTAVAALPQVLLLDEPFSSLDEPTRLAIHQDVFDITREFGITTVLVTHDLAEAISLSDEVTILTRRPATVAARHVMPFGSDRNLVGLRERSDFLALYGELWRELSGQLDVAPSHRKRASGAVAHPFRTKP